DEARYDAPVVWVHPRAISVENPSNLDPQLVLTPIVEEQRFGTTLAFVVAGSQTDRVNVAPIILRLRMREWIAVNFRRRGLQYSCLQPFGEAQHVDCTMYACFCRLDRIDLIVNRGRRAGKVEYLVHLHVQRKAHVVAQELKSGM